MSSARPVIVVAGVDNGSGTGAATARLFAKEGYRVALIARNADHLKNIAAGITAAGGEVVPFPVQAYDAASLTFAFSSIKSQWPDSVLRVAVWNAVHAIWKPFLQITDEEVTEALYTNVRAAFAFSRLAISAFKENELNEIGKRGALIFTGATSSLRGNATTEFGKDNIHVAHAIINGNILTDRVREWRNDPNWEANEDARLNPDSIAKSYLYLTNQDRSAWTWELDLRPAHEEW
ncbi:hypothetical protein ACEPAI_4150 [Sanghuangporus weigelae]